MRKINLGAGDKAHEDYIGIDNNPTMKPGVCRDVTRGLPYDDKSVDAVYTENFLEHLAPIDFVFVMQEIKRVLKTGSSAEIIVPLGVVPDATHMTFFHEYTFENLFQQKQRYALNDLKITNKIFKVHGPPFDYKEMHLMVVRE